LQDLSTVHSALLQRGFVEAKPWEKGIYKYSGYLETSIGPIEVQLRLNGLDKPPSIRLIEVPEILQPISPHIGAQGSLCYTASGSIAMDIFNPASQVLACIKRAEEVLSQVLEGKRFHDLADEFFVYWFSLSGVVFLDTKNTNSQYAAALAITDKDGEITSGIILTDDRERSLKKIAAIGCGITEYGFGACIIATDAIPMPLTNSANWPPSTINELVSWQRDLDPNCSKKILRRLKHLYEQSKFAALILISSPTAKYSGFITFPEQKTTIKSRNHARKKLGSTRVTIMNTVRIDDAYIVERNQPGRRNLIGMKLLLIGAGAIGGYLADLLVKSGAGLGEGRFVILDTESLAEGNLGRHRLGFESLHQQKSQALATQLKVSFPTANVEGMSIDAKTYPLTGFDLIVNATGEQSLSDWLSAQLNQNCFTPILHAWIEGSGTVARTMLQSAKGKACYRCLADHQRDALYPATHEPYNMKIAGHGCEGLYVPFPATAAVFAASLAATHILEWMNAEESPALRTILLDRHYHLLTPDQDPSKQSGCPACHTITNG